MPGVARKGGVDLVNTVHAAIGSDCDDAPTIISTDLGSSTVFANGIGVVRVGDNVQIHNVPGCSLHAPPLASGSTTVFADFRPIGRIGDVYAGGEVIISGSSTVIAG